MECAIEIKGLTKQFSQNIGRTDFFASSSAKGKITALHDISLQVKKGELLGILGPNGAGKTTLIKILSTLILPTKGTARINGYDLTGNPEDVKKSIGLINCDERSFYWRLTGRQNLRFFAALHGIYGSFAEKRINTALKVVNLQDEADKRFDSYSTGMKQRMAIARGLLNSPGILLMDEPTKGLDPANADNIRDFIKHELVKKQGKTIVLTTHNMEEAEQICDRVAIIDNGELKALGTIKELKALTGKSNLHSIFLNMTKK